MLLYDIETNGLLDDCTKLHSLVINDLSTGEQFSCADDSRFLPLEHGLNLLEKSDCLAGHNILGFDNEALSKLYPVWRPPKNSLDTLLYSRLIYTNLLESDAKVGKITKANYGRHSLASWGERLGEHKGDFSKWETWTMEMQVYCAQDVKVNKLLLDKLLAHNYSEEAIRLEHEFSVLMHQQQRTGIPFDKAKAELLYVELLGRSESLTKNIKQIIPDWILETVIVPKRNNRTLGYVKGVPFTKRKSSPFNPGSRNQIYKWLHGTYQWEPDERTEKDNPKMSADILENLQWPEAKLCCEYLQVKALMGKIKTAKGAWLKNVESDGRIHGYVNTNGAVTGRCTHSNPNLSQVPSPRKLLGKECRSLFHAPNGMVIVGCDGRCLELRMLAHFLAPYDGGRYVDIVTTGDVHTVNQEASGCTTRDIAKRFIYAFLYGAGDAKIGEIVKPEGSKKERAKIGKKLKTQFMKNTPGLRELMAAVKNAARRGHLVGLDGRHLHIRSLHSALNTLLQSAGGLVMKKATCIMHVDVKDYWSGVTMVQALNVHDENQVFAYPDEGEEVGKCMRQGIIKAGEYFNLRCPLDAEYQIGDTWADTH